MHREMRYAKRRRGVSAVQVLVLLPVLVGMATMTVDVGVMYNARADLQDAADASSLAAIGVIAFTLPDDLSDGASVSAALDYINRNHVIGNTMTIDPGTDIVYGRAYYDEVGNSYDFVPGDAPVNAVRVTVRHTEDSANGSLPLLFGSLFGDSGTDLTASSVAMFVGTDYEEGDCYDNPPGGYMLMCHYGDSDDSDDSEAGTSDDSDFSDAGDSDGSHDGDIDDSDDSAAGTSDDSDDSGDSDSDSGDSGDSESGDSSDSDGGHTIIIESGAAPFYLQKGDTVGACPCIPGDSDDSDDSEAGDSSDSDDSDPGDSDGSFDGDSDDSDDSEGGFSDDSDDSDAGDSDGSFDGDSDDSDDSEAGTSDDSDDSVAGYAGSGDSDSDSGGPPPAKVSICHIPPGNPDNAFTISVGASAVAAHMAHGDTMGDCPTAPEDIRVFLIE